MGLTILSFAADHAEPAAALLAARHRHDRARAPDLPAEFEDPAATLPILRDLLAAAGTSGVVGLREGAVVGYLLGAPEPGSPTRAFAGFAHPRAVEIPYAGHAAAPGDGAALYPRLYAALAQRWVADGLVGHDVTVPAAPDATEPWLDLGFGRFLSLGVRPTAPPAGGARPAADVEVRRAVAGDEEAVQALVAELFRTFANPPIWVPFLPETAAERRLFVAERLADLACPHWLAFANDRPVGVQAFEEPVSPHWHQPALETPRRAVYLSLACTAPEARGTGVGAALFVRAMTWAREAGYDSCTTQFLTASRAAPFWRGLGFRPVSYQLHRTVDERVTWARG